MIDLILENVRVSGRRGLQSITVSAGRIAAIDPEADKAIEAQRIDCADALATAGFVEAHIHLDKAMILDRCPICEGTLDEAVRLTANAKAGFTEEDVYDRAATVLERAVRNGTVRMRSFVEVDPRVRLRGFEALRRLRNDYADIIDLELCAFAQEGLTNELETLDFLDKTLAGGADSVGGCPYTDPDPVAHVGLIFDLAARYGVAVDFHADFDLDPDGSILPEIVRETTARRMEGRVTVGHATKLTAMSEDRRRALSLDMAAAGIGLTVLPATDLYLNGRGDGGLAPRGVAPAHEIARHGVCVSLATNNILNPFTPFGDASLLRMAGLYANIGQLASDAEMETLFGMVSTAPARQLGHEMAIEVGAAATIVLLDAASPADAVRTGAEVLGILKNGRKVLWRPRAELIRG